MLGLFSPFKVFIVAWGLVDLIVLSDLVLVLSGPHEHGSFSTTTPNVKVLQHLKIQQKWACLFIRFSSKYNSKLRDSGNINGLTITFLFEISGLRFAEVNMRCSKSAYFRSSQGVILDWNRHPSIEVASCFAEQKYKRSWVHFIGCLKFVQVNNQSCTGKTFSTLFLVSKNSFFKKKPVSYTSQNFAVWDSISA